MPWRPLPRIAFAICTYPFEPSSAADLPLQIGDELYIIEQGGKDGSWYRGYLVAPPSLLAGLTSTKGHALEARVFSGIFPSACVEIRELLGEVTKYGHDDQYVGEAGLKVNGAARLSESWPVPPRRGSETVAGQMERAVDKVMQQQHQLQPHTVVVTTIPAGQKPPAPVPMLKIGDESTTSKDEPLVDEIASCLKEWHSAYLHEQLLGRKYPLIHDMSALVDRLDSSRRLLLHKTLTKWELAQLRQSTIWDLVNGNKALSGEVIVRSTEERGRILTADDSAITMSKLQATMSLSDGSSETAPEQKTLHHLLVTVQSIALLPTDKSPIYSLGVFVKASGEPAMMVSENFMMDGAAAPTSRSGSHDERHRTLFINLNHTSLTGSVKEGSKFFLVVKVLTTEPHHESLMLPMKAPAAEPGLNSTINASISNINATIRGANFMSGRKGSKPNFKEAEVKRPVTSSSQKPSGKSDSAGADSLISSSANKGSAKRTTSVGVLDITEFMKQEMEADRGMILWSASPTDSSSTHPERDSNWNGLIREIMPLVGSNYSISPWSNPFDLSIQSFMHEDADALIRHSPTLFHSIQTTPRMGFTGAPTQPRSDIYITLREPLLASNGFLSHPQLGSVPLSPEVGTANLQLTLEVRDANGARISHCIHPSSNAAGHTAWRTTAVENGEFWNQTIRLAINPKDVPGSHIVMSIADGANFPFALSWMPLWTDEAFIRDGEHVLVLYKYDEQTSNMYNGKGAYLKLPWSSKAKDETVTGPVASVRLQTYLCSTKYSQNPTLLGVLKWRETKERGLIPLLKQFAFVPEIEIVKLLPEVFDALFGILVDDAGNEELEDAVFNAVVFVSSIIHDRRFNLGPLVEDYIRNRFNFPFAFPCLIRSFVRLLSNPTDTEVSRQLRATCKVAGHMLKFMICARQQQIEKEVGIGIKSHAPTFAHDLQMIFDAVENMMRMQSSVLIGTKTIVVQHFPSWLPELVGVMTASEIADIAAGFVDSCSRAEGRLILYKLVLILQLSSTSIMSTEEVQKAWHKRTLRWIEQYWGMTFIPSPQWREQIRLCCTIIATQVETFSLKGALWVPKLIESYVAIKAIPRPAPDSFSLLFPRTIPFPSRPLQTNDTYDEALIEIAALLSNANNDLSDYNIAIEAGLSDLFPNALKLCKSILNGEAFPSSWLSLYVFQHKSILQFLEILSEILLKEYLPQPDDASDFSTEIWGDFFTVLLMLCSSQALALEAFPEQKRRAVWKIAGDVRELGADLLQRMWQAIGWDLSSEDQTKFSLEKMGGYQVQYVPQLVGPIVELCLSVHEGLRSVAIEVLRTMIVSEWVLSQDLSVIQTEIVSCLDSLFKSKTLKDSVPHKIFVADLLEPFEPDTPVKDQRLYAATKAMVDVIDELLERLIAVHTSTSSEASRIIDTLQLMMFLKDIQKTDIYVDYIHKLVQIQETARHPTEAGLALKLHADLYKWDINNKVDAITNPAFPAQTEFERKEHLYLEMIKYFEDGSAWHFALGAYADLARVYEYTVFDFPKLARAHRAIASIQERISRGDRQSPKFFRVLYRGLGCPTSLRGRQYIVEGSPTDRLSTFTDKMLSQHPSAQIAGGDDADELEGLYLSIYPVNTQRNFYHAINRRPKVPPAVRDHHTMASPKQFSTTSRRQPSHGGGVQDQSVEKIVYTTADAFPTILRQSEIVKTETVVMAPVQIGLERTTRKTQELLTLESELQSGQEPPLPTLTEMLNILVSPKSSGGVADYWSLVTNPLPLQRPGLGELESEQALYDALKVVLLDHATTIGRCLQLYTRPSDQATKRQLQKDFEASFAPIIEEIRLALPPPIRDAPSVPWQHGASLPEAVSTFTNTPATKAAKAAAAAAVTAAAAKELPGSAPTETMKSSSTHKTSYLPSLKTIGSGFKSPTRNLVASSRSSTSSRGQPSAPAPNVGYTNGSSHKDENNSSNNTHSADEELSGASRLVKQASAQSLKGLQARMGSATKRLSSLNLGKRAVRLPSKSKGVSSIEE